MPLVSLAKNPVPSGATTGDFPGYDGAPLRYARWSATRGPARGTFCVFTGRSEYIEKYFEVIADLRRRGFAVAIHDWRGQGGSHRMLPNPRKGHIKDFSEFDRDLAAFMQQIVLPECPPPYYALAHSMGGNILARHAVATDSWFERIVLSAPMFEILAEKERVPAGLARFFVETACLLGFSTRYVPTGSDQPAEMTTFEGNMLTSDRERYMRNRQVIEAAPELALGYPTDGWTRAAYRSCAHVMDPAFARRVKVPLLLFSAANDRIVSSRAIEAFASRLKIGAHVTIPQSQHEIMQENDTIRQHFWSVFDAYLGIDANAA
ncbi:MAG: alpha/beta hydrolase [Hyphomicrobium sp.]|nr:alpha/beta hydrolase [Hyphomicrobium sp.]MBN9263496.1 alpha/beta hydrolase [Hyphomicrobium sp.]MBN9276598.1 alpha/beta hydrolase [Hyphomicrobium sp.]ODT23210.1 MAG: alpha/beta hydrolase [Hyphomicrobium sp. SCN 65-11]